MLRLKLVQIASTPPQTLSPEREGLHVAIEAARQRSAELAATDKALAVARSALYRQRGAVDHAE